MIYSHKVAQNRSCEMCSKPLFGQNGAAEVSEPYVSIKGSMQLQLKSDSGRRYYVNVLSNPDHLYCFCDLVCLQSYCDLRERMRTQEHQAELRRQASEEWMTRGGGGTHS